MSVNLRQALENTQVNYSQALVNASYTLTRDQKRILWLFLADLDEVEGSGVVIDSEQGVLGFQLNAYERIYNLTTNEASRDVRAALASFKECEVRFYVDEHSTETEAATDDVPWLAKRSYRPKRGSYTVYFNPYLVPYLVGIKKHIGAKFRELDKLPNPLHIKLYIKLIEREDEKHCLLDVKWIVQRFELPKTYERYSNFKQKFLVPCIDKLKELDGMAELSYSELKTDPKKPRAVSTIEFKW